MALSQQKKQKFEYGNVIPFLAWAGGKRWFVQNYAEVLPTQFNRYFEPFLGGGSVFFHLKPQVAFLGDCNHNLIDTYSAIKKNYKDIVVALKKHHKKHNKSYYYATRAKEPSDLVEKAARFIYLNRTCFNGIYRVNRLGIFNVPIGTKSNVILDTDDFETLSNILQGATLVASDFEVLIDKAEEGDLIFADPPYTVRHNHNGFVKYNENLFSWNDQVRLAAALNRAKERNVHIVCTNANHESVRKLYRSKSFKLRSLSRYSSISATRTSRSQYKELVVTTTT